MKTVTTWGWLALLVFSTADVCADAPPPPQNVLPAWIHFWPENYARLNWDASPGAESYRVYRQNETTSVWEVLAGSLTNLVFFDAQAGAAEKSYYVTAVGPDGESVPSAVVTTHDSDFIPYFIHTPPDWSGQLTPTSAVISWVSSLVSGSDAMLEIGPTATNLAVFAFNPAYVAGAQFLVTNLTPLTEYTYRISSVGTNRTGTAISRSFTTPDVNHPPTAHDLAVGPVVDPWPITLTLSATDPDWTAYPLEFRVVSTPTNGTVSPIYYYDYYGPRFVDYTPNPGARGEDRFQYVANDGELDSAPATVALTNMWLNRAPQVVSFSTNTVEDVPLSLSLQVTDEDGDPVTIEFGGCLHCTVTGNPTNVLYQPEPNYSGSDVVLFQVNDGYIGGLVQAVISIEIASVNDAPVAEPLGFNLQTDEDQPVAFTLLGSDVEGDALTFILVDGPAHGSLTGTPPELAYAPAPNYHGPESFTFKVNDGQLDSAPTTIQLTVRSINDPAEAQSQSVSVSEDSTVNVVLTATDVDGPGLSFSVLGGPAHGTLSGTPPTLAYQPAPNYVGNDSFTFVANDGMGDGVPGEISILVVPVNDVPVAHAQAVNTAYNTAASVVLSGSDVDGDSLAFSVLSSPANGALSGSPPTLSFTPNVGWSGVTSFTFKVNDGSIDSPAATVNLTVAAPTAVPAAPTGLTATPVSRTQINLAWTDNSNNEDGFKIERSTSPTTGWTQIATVGPGLTNFASTGLNPNKVYYHRVRAHNVLGNSPYSNTASARTLK